VRFCVDTQGKLLGAPTVAKSSGNRDLDSAGVLLATFGSGHYVPGRRDGVPVSACSEMRVRFQIPEDPRWPTLAHRQRSLEAHLAQGIAALNDEAEKAPAPRSPYPSSTEDAAAIRLYAKHFDDLRTRGVALTREYIAGMDELSQMPGAPIAERDAFQVSWNTDRELLDHYSSEMDQAGQDLVKVMIQVVEFYEQSNPPLLTPSGVATPTKVQAQKLRNMAERGARASARLEAAMESLKEHSGAGSQKSADP
jgi:hypothetical protein